MEILSHGRKFTWKRFHSELFSRQYFRIEVLSHGTLFPWNSLHASNLSDEWLAEVYPKANKRKIELGSSVNPHPPIRPP